ncbi:chromosomal replication initiator protein DnaA [Candidatus Woesebacteria bacterium GWA1_41_8]|uniref:Chromosomal replication initiator protein DnaA n=1 Tax=Candidatus Woesebacteria bacterium GWA1_41_8 TaxID=1802471 RepID=A0A1F7WJ52_9BACT|nr:MAG: chromosomal replication initiator protein DnaA [Candidatus Woesebacteria bacterium GWA1_41_8]
MEDLDSNDTNKIWTDVLESLRVTVSPAIFSTWFNQTHLVSLTKNNNRVIAEIGCTSSFVRATIEGRYYGLIQDNLTKILDSPSDLVFSIKQLPKSLKTGLTEYDTPLFTEKKADVEDYLESVKKAKLRSYFTFENFAVSSSNQMAWAAAEAVSKSPGAAYNPLFIWGGVGVGKTHIMNAVGHTILKANPESNIYSCTGEEFTNDIIEGIRNKSTQSFRKKYRSLTALFVDDIQFIAGKDAVQEEFFHTFNALVQSGSQVIMTSDKPPSEISKLEERLKSRFEAGLIVDIAQPDFELRCAIVEIKSKEKDVAITSELAKIIAGNIESARKIEGFLIKLMTETKLKNKPVSAELIESTLGKGLEINNQSLKSSPNELVDAVSKYYSLGKRALLGSSRQRTIARPRQVLMYLLRTQLTLPLEEVGRLVGDRDHTTVMHAVEKITQLATDSVDIREDLQGIKNML